MICYLTLIEVLELHRRIIEQSGRAFVLHRIEINTSVDEQERVILAIASGELRREAFVEWLQRNTTVS